MKYAFYTNIVSPHQVPWCRVFARIVGRNNFCYITDEIKLEERAQLGWEVNDINFDICLASDARPLLETTEVLLSAIRDIGLFASRKKRGLKTYYVSERWFKPPLGVLRLLKPQYFLMSLKFVEFMKQGDLIYLPIGIAAARDMARLIGLFRGDLRCLWQSPSVEMHRREPLSRFESDVKKVKSKENIPVKDHLPGEQVSFYGLDRMHLWGYFVEPSEKERQRSESIAADSPAQKSCGNLRILWVGRMLGWKRVDTLVKAVVQLLNEGAPVALKVIGHGPMEGKLRQLAGRWLIDNQESTVRKVQPSSAIKPPVSASDLCSLRGISFHAPVPITEVRKLMQDADVYVLPSDGGEGWGAVVNEAMAEGCCVIGTQEAGSSGTMIEDGANGFLFPAGDVQALYERLREIANSLKSKQRSDLSKAEVYKICEKGRETVGALWSPGNAARRLFEFCSEHGD